MSGRLQHLSYSVRAESRYSWRTQTRKIIECDGLANWRERLVMRGYREARPAPGPEYSIRIARNGAYAYFPLGTTDAYAAAERASEIDRVIATEGWVAVSQRFEREFTLAVFWCESPAAITYTTLFTRNAPPPVWPLNGDIRMERRKRILLVETDEVVAEGIRFWLNRQPGYWCPDVFADVEVALAQLDTIAPQLVLISRELPDAPKAVAGFRAHMPELPVFTHGVHEDSDQVFSSISGVDAGYILRRRLPTGLLDPLKQVASGKLLSAGHAALCVKEYFQNFFDAPPGASGDRANVYRLTGRENQVLACVSKGYLDKEIAAELNISAWTVSNHLKNIYEKLNVSNRTEAVLKFLHK